MIVIYSPAGHIVTVADVMRSATVVAEDSVRFVRFIRLRARRSSFSQQIQVIRQIATTVAER
jgi:hypothetical protein